MNIYLVPYTWMRHLTLAWVTGGAALVAWWGLLVWAVWIGPELGMMWSHGAESWFYLVTIATTVSFASVLAEGGLRRRRVTRRVMFAALSGLVTLLVSSMGIGLATLVTGWLAGAEMAELADDPSFVSLRYRLLLWVIAGYASGIGPFFTRFDGIFSHVGGGIAAGLIGGAVWHAFAYAFPVELWPAKDLYVASAMGPLAWGLAHGALTWAIPDRLYAGWLRVLSAERFGRRIPIDGTDHKARERFVGSYPRGLDLWMGERSGVAELHASVAVDERHQYVVRGLSQHPTVVLRLLERIDLRFDPRRPAPLETSLEMEDRIQVSIGGAETELEFVMLPKEEQ
jgi:hypothetical protein